MEGYINKAAILTAITKANKEAPISYTHDEIIDLLIEYINDLPTENVNELKEEIQDLNNRRHLIWALGADYDGCNTVESLKGLIDELVSYTQLPREQVPDITSRTGRWIKDVCSSKHGNANCSVCNHWDWSDCDYCSSCGAKMIKEEI